jgi:hypothetical protein
MQGVSNSDSLILDFYSAQLMEFGVRARVERCESSGLLTAFGEGDTWDEATQERLLRAQDVKAANTFDISFTGGWGIDLADCRDSPIKITARRVEAFGTACEFRSTERESSNVWRLRAECSSKNERWNANIRLTVSTSKLTWSSERGTETYVRCHWRRHRDSRPLLPPQSEVRTQPSHVVQLLHARACLPEVTAQHAER